MGNVTQGYNVGSAKHLPDQTPLWRYVPTKTLFLYLTGTVFLPSIEKLRTNDPFEGEFFFDTTIFNHAMQERYKEAVPDIEAWLLSRCPEHEQREIEVNRDYPNFAASICEKRYFEFIRQTRYAFCWFLSDSESAAMWHVYGSQGCAIGTSVGKLRATLEKTSYAFAFGRMYYVDVRGGNPSNFNWEHPDEARFLLDPHFLKRSEYESEKEVRFVTSAPESAPHGGLVLSDVNATDWIREILLWPSLNSAEANALRKAIAELNPDISVARSELLHMEEGAPLLEAFFNLDLDAWRSGSDGIPAVLKDLA